MNSIDKLYSEYPEIYDAFSNDRDFHKQCKSITDIFKRYAKHEESNIIATELFSGPARHSFEFSNLGCQTFSIDSQQSMRDYSVENGFQCKNNYIVDLLPLRKDLKQKTHIFTLLRFSCGYLNKSQMLNLISWCNRNSYDKGLLIIELHSPRSILQDFRNIPIQKRNALCKNKTITCVWPKSIEINTQASITLDMQVGITVNSIEKTYTSSENIHSFEDIFILSKTILGLECFIQKDLEGFDANSVIAVIKLRGEENA